MPNPVSSQMCGSFVSGTASRIPTNFFFSIHRPIWHHTVTDIGQYVPQSQHPSTPIFVRDINNGNIKGKIHYSNIYTIDFMSKVFR